MTTATKSAPKAAASDAIDYKITEAVDTLGGIYGGSMKVESVAKGVKEAQIVIDGDIVHDNLPPGHTAASIKEHQKLRGQVVAALATAAGAVALPALAKNKELDRVTMSTKFGNDKIELAVERNREFGDGNGGKVQKFGHVNLGYTVSGATNAGDFKKVRARIGDEAKALFGG